MGSGTFGIDGRRSRLEYLRVNPATGEREIRYVLQFTAAGRRLLLEGTKHMQRNSTARPESEVLADFTTLHARVVEQAAADAAAAASQTVSGTQREVGRGVLHFRAFEDAAASHNLADFLLSFRVTGTRDPEMKTRARLAFFGFTVRFVQQEYGLQSTRLKPQGTTARPPRDRTFQVWRCRSTAGRARPAPDGVQGGQESSGPRALAGLSP